MTADYDRIETAIRFIAGNVVRQPTLEEVAAEVGLSPFHFQRLFRRWVGVSPKRFLQYLTVDHAKRLLADSATVLDAAFEVGLSSPSRLHDHFVTLEAMTPGDYKRLGSGLDVRYGFHDSPFGRALAAVTDRGVCALAFETGRPGDAMEPWLSEQWPLATLYRDDDAVRPVAERIFDGDESVPLLVRGTNFQVQVWKALLSIPAGSLVSYQSVAEAVGRPKAVRAVGSAVGANRLSYLIPCHRVVRSVGALGGYRWGLDRKRAMIAWESARQASGESRAMRFAGAAG